MDASLVPVAIVSGLVTGSFYSLLGLSQVVIFRSSRVLNLASGQFLLLGVYLFFTLSTRLRLPLILALVIGLVLIAAISVLYQLLLIRPLVGQPLFVPVILTFGTGIVLEGIMQIFWGTDSQDLALPFANNVYHLFGAVTVTRLDLVTIAVTVVVIGLFLCFDRYTTLGAQMRACADDATLAEVSGVRTQAVYALSWCIGGVAAMLAGLSYSYSAQLSPTAATLGYIVLAPVLIAGFDSVVGLVIGSVAVAMLQGFVAAYGSSDASDAVVYIVLLVILLWKPRGLFGVRGIERA
jgi:branched-chain amino acid transport system permease protein